MLTDSHAHLDMPEFEKDLEQVLDRAIEGGVTRVITIGIDLQSSLRALELANKYDFIFSTIGYHPHNAKDAGNSQLEELAKLGSEPKVVAWGEVGLDFYRRHSPPEKQKRVFEEQLDMAGHLDLPVIIHDRDAHKEVFEILKKKSNNSRKGVFHCFSGDLKMAMALIEMGFHISIPGTVTYKKASMVQEVAASIPIESLLIETDAPFLTPVPERGKRNEPLFVTYTARKIAELRQMDLRELARRTSENVSRLFRLP